MEQKGEVTIVEERAIIRQRFRFQATWSRRRGENVEDFESAWESADDAVKWGRRRAPFVTVRTSSPSQEWSAGERDPELAAYGAVLPRWPSQTAIPDAEETISYGIPTFKHRGKYLIYFAAFKDHMSVYPTVGAVEATEGTKGTFRFSEDDPVPEEVVRAIVAHRLEVIEG